MPESSVLGDCRQLPLSTFFPVNDIQAIDGLGAHQQGDYILLGNQPRK
jgi:hypothetical protein